MMKRVVQLKLCYHLLKVLKNEYLKDNKDNFEFDRKVIDPLPDEAKKSSLSAMPSEISNQSDIAPLVVLNQSSKEIFDKILTNENCQQKDEIIENLLEHQKKITQVNQQALVKVMMSNESKDMTIKDLHIKRERIMEKCYEKQIALSEAKDDLEKRNNLINVQLEEAKKEIGKYDLDKYKIYEFCVNNSFVFITTAITLCFSGISLSPLYDLTNFAGFNFILFSLLNVMGLSISCGMKGWFEGEKKLTYNYLCHLRGIKQGIQMFQLFFFLISIMLGKLVYSVQLLVVFSFHICG